MRILGIDPGYAIVGYGVIEAGGGRYRPVEYGAITTPAGQDFRPAPGGNLPGHGEIPHPPKARGRRRGKALFHQQ